MWHAVFWDLDGTLVHTGPIWMAAERELAAEHGTEWTRDDGLALVGLALTGHRRNRQGATRIRLVIVRDH